MYWCRLYNAPINLEPRLVCHACFFVLFWFWDWECEFCDVGDQKIMVWVFVDFNIDMWCCRLAVGFIPYLCVLGHILFGSCRTSKFDWNYSILRLKRFRLPWPRILMIQWYPSTLWYCIFLPAHFFLDGRIDANIRVAFVFVFVVHDRHIPKIYYEHKSVPLMMQCWRTGWVNHPASL